MTPIARARDLTKTLWRERDVRIVRTVCRSLLFLFLLTGLPITTPGAQERAQQPQPTSVVASIALRSRSVSSHTPTTSFSRTTTSPKLPRAPRDTTPPPSRIASSDAWLHAGSSAAIQLMGYGGLRVLRVEQREALVTSIGVTLLAGVGKELFDRRRGGAVSASDLFWDLVGIGAGVSLARFADR